MISKILGNTTKWSLIVLTAFLLYFPILVIMFLSINESSGSTSFTGLSLKWYPQIISNSSLFGAITNTLLVSILSTGISTVLGTLISIGIHSLKRRHQKVVMMINNIPMVNADIVTAVSLMVIFSFLGFKFGFQTMLLAHIFFSIPFIVLNVLPRLTALDKDLYNAAIDLGSTRFQALYKVIIPAIKGGIIAGMLIAFTMSIDDFVISYFTTGSGFNNFSIWIYARLGKRTFTPSAYAYNTLITLITMIVVFTYNFRKIKLSKKEEDYK